MNAPIQFSIENYNELVLEKQSHVVRTVSGKPVRIIATDVINAKCPIMGLVLINEGQENECEIWDSYTEDGYYNVGKHPSNSDLVIVPKPPVSLGWVAAARSQFGTTLTISLKPTEQDVKDVGAMHNYTLLSEPIQIFAKP